MKFTPLEPKTLEEATPARESDVYQKLILTELLDKVETRYSRRHRFIVEITEGYTRIEISPALGVSKQRTNMLVNEVRTLVASYL